MIRSSAAVLAALLASTSLTSVSMAQTASSAPAFATSEASDPYVWLEDVEGARAMAWVKDHNTHSLGVLQGDPRYEPLHQQALAIVQARDRIPAPGFTHDGHIDNFWQDAQHVRGVWRRTTLDSYKTAEPQWETVLDIDALAEAESANWVYKGSTCLAPEERYCLISLSNGGKDAVTLREFDSVTRSFVEGGFFLPESKGGATWLNKDTLLISRDFGVGTLTNSGYPMIVKRMMRGQSLDQADVLFMGEPTDVSVSGYTLRDADGALKATLINRSIDFYSSETYRVTDDGAVVKLALPAKSDITGLVAGKLVVSLKQDWTAPSGQDFKSGDLIAWPLDAWLEDQATPAVLVLRPTERQAVEGVNATRNTLVVALYDNVRGSVRVYRPGDSEWTYSTLGLPQNVSAGVGSASETDDKVFVSVTGYLNPSSLWLADAATGAVDQVKSMPAKFDATGMTVDQHEARSADGTMIPYFVVHKADMPLDGSNPTLLYGYGGFESSLLPGYSATVGKLWLERGGVYVIANTRGGGEFGPRWHEAALQQNRQRAHEDFQAVALDLIARDITSQPKLGIMGGSQGGLFMGAMLTQRPDLINAAVIQVPLFDMLRFHKLLAGASWKGEYGDPDVPEERAWIQAYSPYQNLRAGQPYPEVFIHTSTKDDRVHPGHARKAAARLEELGYPVLFYENTDGGHAAGANLQETARRLALEYTYLSRRLMDSPAKE
ncbi:MAG: prolyl oligopeptidase family serine peptidase [Alphaproteobacteria bacterium]|uniref:prolyl oligopeptidase family serine peptidase n=1 Tax=Brevundimonas sp. TaxID=1871086 RepID=UPI001DFCDE95|nr:prolyl oligopeptidase family serine peptidase [Alphaproteobacteria bacterium]MBU1521563.1 prolyl oligopeptidase family serine peptidase [Alphaproteobacteria bacterium]MBU2029598.1 prolyl oligopeptidase family serine peptidase [Alphaproteobacteria bacterium]MBU2164355.1 prolyl oligopeptidase family serine peptidase [Alphaproteobacteria bacterium]MBU2231938.1 prolyl oligopeptidase family serine peptidase [Alphaproteobacteria bacterium]